MFLVSAADDGSRVVFFVAQNSRHAILDADLQVEQQLNLLWPVRTVSREEALAYPEGAPVGEARAGLLRAPAPEVDVAEVRAGAGRLPRNPRWQLRSRSPRRSLPLPSRRRSAARDC